MADGIGLAEGQEMTRAHGKGKVRKTGAPKNQRLTGFEEDIQFGRENVNEQLSDLSDVLSERTDLILRQGLQIAAASAMGSLCRSFGQWLHRCESPIEQTFAAALIVESMEMGERWFPDSYLCIKDPRHFLDHEMEDWLADQIRWQGPTPIGILTQVPIEQFRVDFLFYGISANCDDRSRWKHIKLIVECDGHEFHEKTKDQAKRDKRRDRCLMALGYHVMRFTGSEIWNDPRKCMLEARQFVGRLQYEYQDDGVSP